MRRLVMSFDNVVLHCIVLYCIVLYCIVLCSSDINALCD